MFSLPNIKAMHERAIKEREEVKREKTFRCDDCGEEFNIAECREQGQVYFIEEFHDSLSEGVKGLIYYCPACVEQHEERWGRPYSPDDYFECEDCQQLHVVNYSWEIYRKITEDGEELCIPCHRARALADEDYWLRNHEDIAERCSSVERLAAWAKHLSCIGSEYDWPEGVKSFRDTDEYEAEGENWYSRMEVGGYGGSGDADVRECARTAFRFYSEITVVLAEAGQFQAYMDILVKTDSKREEALPVLKKAG